MHKLDDESPDKDAVLAARLAANLTQREAAHLIHLGSAARWTEYESGTRQIGGARWTLFLLLVDLHPDYRLVKRRLG